jgi:hypothetical protein
MAQFTLTARNNIDRPGCHISRGTTFDISINIMGITPNNLFNNPRCADQLSRQFKINGIDLPMTDRGVFSKGAWDIQMTNR